MEFLTRSIRSEGDAIVGKGWEQEKDRGERCTHKNALNWL